MAKRLDLVGMSFGRLTVIHFAGKNKYNQALWICECACGEECTVSSNALVGGKTRSCGCLDIERRATQRGESRSPEYVSWSGAKLRCEAGHKHYGARGITISKRWTGKNGFRNFLQDMGRKPSPELTLERKNNNGPYSPRNCKWADRLEQANNKRNNLRITFGGLTKTIPEWSRLVGLSAGTLRARLLNSGWTTRKALLEPLS